ncbi:hypothetical protein QBC43DRAFT_331919 [Cladorrhinum sp. PSN259]|nr:hypothetical protein QBC43DRAFT_331919 [Cladorrhinum sp. PSN259]
MFDFFQATKRTEIGAFVCTYVKFVSLESLVSLQIFVMHLLLTSTKNREATITHFCLQAQWSTARQTLAVSKLMDVDWVLYNFRHDRSVILVDKMDLGKTVQVGSNF